VTRSPLLRIAVARASVPHSFFWGVQRPTSSPLFRAQAVAAIHQNFHARRLLSTGSEKQQDSYKTENKNLQEVLDKLKKEREEVEKISGKGEAALKSSLFMFEHEAAFSDRQDRKLRYVRIFCAFATGFAVGAMLYWIINPVPASEYYWVNLEKELKEKMKEAQLVYHEKGEEKRLPKSID